MSKKNKTKKLKKEPKKELETEIKSEQKENMSENSDTKESENTEKNIETPKKELSWEEKYNSLNDKYFRLTAEFDNYRKRTLKERMDLIKSAGEDILINFLPVVDNIERAKKSIEEAKEIEPIKEGIDLIFKNMTDFLSQRGIKEIEAVGEEFDTDLHEAITKIPAPEENLKGKVVDVIEKGYKLHDKIIRFSKVVIGE